MVAIILLGHYYLQSYNNISCYKSLNEKFGIKEYIFLVHCTCTWKLQLKLNKYFYI